MADISAKQEIRFVINVESEIIVNIIQRKSEINKIIFETKYE